jgi:DNA-binding response OmpR family regulator
MDVACYIRCDITFARVQEVLAQSGFKCHRFVQEAFLLRALRRESFRLILAETEEGADGETFSWMNSRTGETTPVVMISAMHNMAGVTRALEAGADSFIYFPQEISELAARLNAILRRYDRRLPQQRTIELEGFRLNRDTGVLTDNGVCVDLTPREFMMAWVLFSSAGTFLTRDTISIAIWGVDSEITNRTIEQHVYKLRKKLNLGNERGAWIRTVYTRGYCLQTKANADTNTADALESLEAAA